MFVRASKHKLDKNKELKTQNCNINNMKIEFDYMNMYINNDSRKESIRDIGITIQYKDVILKGKLDIHEIQFLNSILHDTHQLPYINKSFCDELVYCLTVRGVCPTYEHPLETLLHLSLFYSDLTKNFVNGESLSKEIKRMSLDDSPINNKNILEALCSLSNNLIKTYQEGDITCLFMFDELESILYGEKSMESYVELLHINTRTYQCQHATNGQSDIFNRAVLFDVLS